MNIFNTPLTALKGVGKKRCEILRSLGINTIYDLLYYFPSRYEDRRNFVQIEDVVEGNEVCIKGTLKTSVRSVKIRNNLVISNCIIYDETGELMVVWYNQRYVDKQLLKGHEYNFYGKIKRGNGRLELSSPVFEKVDNSKGYTGRVVPVYPLSSKIPQKIFAKIIESAFEYSENILTSILPLSVEKKYNILDIKSALNGVHFPENEQTAGIARKRFAFEEFFYFQIMLFKVRNSGNTNGLAFKKICADEFIKRLPFTLTDGQLKAIEDIKADFKSGKQMNRLLQGDVGSGKTAVSMVSAYIALKNGYRVAVIAPTEILAKQHYKNFTSLFSKSNIQLLTSSIKSSTKIDILKQIEEDNVDILIGTHAILEDSINIKNLGLVIIDEQHRFGVRQRQALIEKGLNPHILTMTATPIPRTISLVMFNDLSVSSIDMLPVGRKPIKTYLVGESYRNRVYNFLKKEVENGGQAYIVCPLVEGIEDAKLKDAVGLTKELSVKLPELKFGVLHGKMKEVEKSAVMQQFLDKAIDVLVATTVVEVGIDVKNATLMIVENSERFGLSQLHQLRGRVGRGEKQSYCILIANTRNQDTINRLKVIEKSNDGFYISEQDLLQRGPGDFIGIRQHGLPTLNIQVGEGDLKLLNDAKQAVMDIKNKLLIPDSKEKQIMKFITKQMLNSENNANILN